MEITPVEKKNDAIIENLKNILVEKSNTECDYPGINGVLNDVSQAIEHVSIQLLNEMAANENINNCLNSGSLRTLLNFKSDIDNAIRTTDYKLRNVKADC